MRLSIFLLLIFAFNQALYSENSLNECHSDLCQLIRGTQHALTSDYMTNEELDKLALSLDQEMEFDRQEAQALGLLPDANPFLAHAASMKEAIVMKKMFNSCNIESGLVMEGVVDYMSCEQCQEEFKDNDFIGSGILDNNQLSLFEDVVKYVEHDEENRAAEELVAGTSVEISNFVDANRQKLKEVTDAFSPEQLTDKLNAIVDRANQQLSALQLPATCTYHSRMGWRLAVGEIPLATRDEYQKIYVEFSNGISELGPLVYGKGIFEKVRFPPSLNFWKPEGAWEKGSCTAVYSGKVGYIPTLAFGADRATVNNAYTHKFSVRDLEKGIESTRNLLDEEQEDATALVTEGKRSDFVDTANYSPSVIGRALVKNGGSLGDIASVCKVMKEVEGSEKREERARFFRRMALGLCGVGAIATGIVATPVAGMAVGAACGGLGVASTAFDLVQQGQALSEIRQTLIAETGNSLSEERLREEMQLFDQLAAELIVEVGLTALDVAQLVKGIKSAAQANRIMENIADTADPIAVRSAKSTLSSEEFITNMRQGCL